MVLGGMSQGQVTKTNCLKQKNRLESRSMDEIFERLISGGFSELAGLTLDASIPVPERLINEIIGVAIRGNKNISHCRVSISRQNRVSVNLKTSRWPWPLELKLKMHRAVDFMGSPKIRAQLENKVLLGRLGSFFKVLPDGVRIHGDQVIVDVGAFPQTAEQKRLLDLVESAEIKTEEGRVIFDLKAKVD
jgi:hypothetical protein